MLTTNHFARALMLASTMLAGSGAWAQEQDQEITTLEEIVITAQKRAQTLQDVPIAVSAYSDADLEIAGVRDIESLMTLSPSLTVQSSNSESGGSTFRLRGVGTTGNNVGLEGSVGVFLDGVYLSRPGIAFSDFLDIERIEVLRGPQGTLFGRNTSAGAIAIHTRKPNLVEPEVEAQATYGNFDQILFSGLAGVPLVQDELAVRIAASFNNRDGFRESIVDDELESNDRDRYSIRGQLLWAPTDAVELRLIGDYMNANDERCCDAMILQDRPDRDTGLPQLFAFGGVAAVINNPMLPPAAIADVAARFPGLGSTGISVFGEDAVDRRITNSEVPFFNPQEQWGISAELNWNLNDDITFTYIGSFRDYDSSQIAEADFTSFDLIRVADSTGLIETWSHEARLQGSNDWLDWLVGVYYSDEEIDNFQRLAMGADYDRYANIIIGALTNFGLTGLPFNSLPTISGVPLGQNFAPDEITENFFEQDATSFSIFTHNVISITDRLDLTLGLRFTDENKDGRFEQLRSENMGCTTTSQQNLAVLRQILLNAPTTNVPTPFRNDGKSVGQEIFETIQALTCFPFVSPLVPEFDQEFNDEELSGTAVIAYDVTDQVNIYGSYSRGYKAGGFNLDPTAAVVDPLDPTQVGDASFESETVNAFEVGLKGTFANGRFRTNIAAFYMDFSDFQILEFDGVQFVVQTLSEATSKGVELEASWLPVDELELNFAATYADAEYPDSVAGDLTTVNPFTGETVPDEDSIGFKVAGRPLTNAPEWVLFGGATYTTKLTDSLAAFFHVDARYDSEKFTGTTPAGLRLRFTAGDDETPDGSDTKRQDGAIKVNGRIGFGDDEGMWRIEGWARNIFDKTTKQIVFGIPVRGGALGAFTDDPRTYGVTARFKF